MHRLACILSPTYPIHLCIFSPLFSRLSVCPPNPRTLSPSVTIYTLFPSPPHTTHHTQLDAPLRPTTPPLRPHPSPLQARSYYYRNAESGDWITATLLTDGNVHAVAFVGGETYQVREREHGEESVSRGWGRGVPSIQERLLPQVLFVPRPAVRSCPPASVTSLENEDTIFPLSPPLALAARLN